MWYGYLLFACLSIFFQLYQWMCIPTLLFLKFLSMSFKESYQNKQMKSIKFFLILTCFPAHTFSPVSHIEAIFAYESLDSLAISKSVKFWQLKKLYKVFLILKFGLDSAQILEYGIPTKQISPSGGFLVIISLSLLSLLSLQIHKYMRINKQCCQMSLSV